MDCSHNLTLPFSTCEMDSDLLNRRNYWNISRIKSNLNPLVGACIIHFRHLGPADYDVPLSIGEVNFILSLKQLRIVCNIGNIDSVHPFLEGIEKGRISFSLGRK